jgi:hypothetical protein
VGVGLCVDCHHLGNQGECALAEDHDTNYGYKTDCLECHDLCVAPPPETTTTTATVTLGEICPMEEIYGTDSEEAELLRFLRDEVLMHTPEGREIVRLYYTLSPAMVHVVKKDDILRAEIQGFIELLLAMVFPN